MKILIAGGTGFIGKSLEQYYRQKGHDISVLTRTPLRPNEIQWDAKSLGPWTCALSDTDVLINLTGKSVDCRYTPANKKEILQSRLESTAVLNQALLTVDHSVKVFLNASSATIYDHSLHRANTEQNGIIGTDFSMDVVKAWESAFFDSAVSAVRKVAMRISIVLGNDGGAFPKMKLIAKLGLGGHQGVGNQMISWVHVDDLVRAIDHIILDEELSGPINITSPDPVTNGQLMKILRQAYRMPIGLPQPKWLLEIGSFFLRTETELLLKSRYVLPKKLINTGFRFTYEELAPCMAHLSNPTKKGAKSI